ncbi:M48 family metallopeptidase [Desulfobacterales bacterium HSG2]|nr:M48 family metallopeptidase [Desulfobacterales bacterium HSG2]
MSQNILYQGGAFHNGLSDGRAFGKITVTSDSLHFETEGSAAELPLQGLVIKAGGAGDRMLFFTHNSVPGWTLHTTDHSILNNMNLTSYSDMAGQIARIQGAKKRSKMVLIAFVVLCMAGIYGLLSLKEPLVTAAAKRMPAKWEQKLGDAAFYQLKAGKDFVEDKEATELLKQISAPLFSRIPEKRHAFTVHIAKDEAVNAFALPGGHIVLNTGLLLSAESAEEALGVLAHEAAHVTLQHGLKQLLSSAGIYILIQAFLGDAEGLLAIIADNGAFLLTQKYSRDYEREADDKGWSYLVNAEINPRGMIVFFSRLLEEEEKMSHKSVATVGDTLNFLSTHPTTRERIEYLQRKGKEIDRRSGYVSFDSEFRRLQDVIREKK